MDRKKAREWNMENSEAWIGLLQRLNDEGFLNDPKGIINLDESPFMMGLNARQFTRNAGRSTSKV